MANGHTGSGRHSFDVDELDHMQVDIEQWVKSVTETLALVESVIAELSESTVWSGEANTAYQSRHRDWLENLKRLQINASDMADWASHAAAAYRKVLAINIGMARQ